MPITSFPTVTIERYQPGARWAQGLVCGGVLLAGLGFTAVGYFAGNSECYLAWWGLGPIVTVVAVFFLRSVTFHLNPSTRQVQREARWAGALLSTVTLQASEYTVIRIGQFSGSGESLPTYWAQLIGPVNYTLVESTRLSEVKSAAQLAGETLRLLVQ